MSFVRVQSWMNRFLLAFIGVGCGALLADHQWDHSLWLPVILLYALAALTGFAKSGTA